MPLQEQVVEFPFSGGLDEKTRGELVPQGTFAKLQNAVQLKHGAVGKAPGFTSLTSNALTAGYRVMGTGNETLVVADGPTQGNGVTDGSIEKGLFSYSPSAAAVSSTYAMQTIGQVTGQKSLPPTAVVRSRTSLDTGSFFVGIAAVSGIFAQDMAVTNGFMAVLWVIPAGTPAAVTIYDLTTGTLVSAVTLANLGLYANIAGLSGPARLSTVNGSNKFVLVYADNATTIKASFYDTSAPSATWSVASFSTIAIESIVLDLIPGTGSVGFAIGYANIATGIGVVKSYNTVGTLINTSANFGTTVTAVALANGTSNKTWVAYVENSTDTKVLGLNSSLVVNSTVATIVAGAGGARLTMAGVDATGMGVVVNGAASVTSWATFKTVAGATQVAGLSATTQHAINPLSRAFVVNSHPYIMASYWPLASTDLQNTTVCIDLSNPDIDTGTYNAGLVVATVAPRLSASNYTLNPTYAQPSGVYVSGSIAYTINTVAATSQSSATELVALDFASPYNYTNAPYLNGIAICSGTPSYYDGASVFEHSFIVAPFITTVTFSGTPGTNAFPNAGTWSWVAIYEWVDAKGQLHQSQPSLPKTGTSGADHTTCTLVVSQCYLTSRYPQPTIVLYRTINGGATYYRAGVATAGSYADTTTDALVGANALLYTQPGTVGTALPRQCPPSLLGLISHADRLFGYEGLNVWYSGQAVVGEGPWWSDEFQFPVLAGVGPITGIASMDGNLLIFKRNRIFVVSGTGPADNGSGNDLSTPSQLPVDAGCIEPRSIVVTSAGCWFQSLRGLELLNRSLQLENFAGQAVEDTLTTYPTITSAVVHEQAGRVYWTARTSDTSTPGCIVMHDLVHGVWSIRPNTTSSGPKHAALLGTGLGVTPTYSWLSDQGTVYQETTSSYLDTSSSSGPVAGVFAGSTIQTGPIKLAGIAGFQRVREIHILGKANTRSDITVSLDYDNAGTFAETHAFTAAQIAAFTTLRMIVSIRPGRQKCRSITLKITDATPSSGNLGTGQGCTFIGLRFRIGIKPGSARIPAANRA